VKFKVGDEVIIVWHTFPREEGIIIGIGKGSRPYTVKVSANDDIHEVPSHKLKYARFTQKSIWRGK